mmetsp:Transcript_28876/g.33181  ORF Transcript_28876/g.33181 Transcript_28876/m.33181 type:complete len:175 (-) Transcript_28876:662-1186(-)
MNTIVTIFTVLSPIAIIPNDSIKSIPYNKMKFLLLLLGTLSLFQLSSAFTTTTTTTTPSLSRCDRNVVVARGPVSRNSLCHHTKNSPSTSSISTRSTSTTTTLFFFGGAAKDDGTPGDYVCKDCGYVFTKGPKAWGKLNESYGCPPCGSPKFRFKKVAKGTESGKVTIKKGWFD